MSTGTSTHPSRDLAGFASRLQFEDIPEAGEHTDSILRAFGYDDPAIAGLRSEGAV